MQKNLITTLKFHTPQATRSHLQFIVQYIQQ